MLLTDCSHSHIAFLIELVIIETQNPLLRREQGTVRSVGQVNLMKYRLRYLTGVRMRSSGSPSSDQPPPLQGRGHDTSILEVL